MAKMFDDDDLCDDFGSEDERDSEFGLTNEDLGLCPHGAADDEGCDEPGCPGGPAAYDRDDGW
jgi:hypothetical protein